jgi:AraC-like DNA-binding protein
MAYRANESDLEQISGVVRVGAPDGFGSVFLAPRMHQLMEHHPKLEVEIFAAARVFSLSKCEADIGIGLAGADHMRVASRRLTDYRLQIYGSRAYLEKSPPIHEKADLQNHPFVGYVEEMLFAPVLNFADGAGVKAGVRIVPQLRSTALLTQVHAIVGGHALVMLADPAFEWTVEGLAEMASMSRATFLRAFARVAGASPWVLLTQVRMEMAFNLLSQSHLGLSHIAVQVGYQSQSAFSKKFKEFYGEAPGKLRREM